MGCALPQQVLIKPYACGMPSQALFTLYTLVTQTIYVPWPGHPMERALLRGVMIRRYKCGMRTQASLSSRIQVTLELSGQYAGHLIVHVSPQEAQIKRCRYGMLLLRARLSPTSIMATPS